MINLLSYDKKNEIRAGKANVIILKYIFISLAAAILLGLIIAGAYITLELSRENAQNRINQNSTEIAKYEVVKTRAETFRANLATAKQIIDNEIAYSSAYIKIAQVIPAGVVIDTLDLNSTSPGSSMTFTARANSSDSALALKSSFQDHPEIFSNVYFDSITTPTDSNDEDYPVTVTITATLTKDLFS